LTAIALASVLVSVGRRFLFLCLQKLTKNFHYPNMLICWILAAMRNHLGFLNAWLFPDGPGFEKNPIKVKVPHTKTLYYGIDGWIKPSLDSHMGVSVA